MNFFNKGDVDNKNYPFNLSHRAKIEKDFAAARAMMDYYNTFRGDLAEKNKRYDENFNLHRGAWPELASLQSNTSINIYNENITLSGGVLRHYPYLNRVSQAIVGDLITTPLIPVFRDVSTTAKNHRDRVRAKKVQEFFINKYITPKVDIIKSQMPPEELAKAPDLDAQLEQAIKTQLPEEILEGIDEFKTPDELLIEILFDWVMKREKVKDKIDMGADYAVVVAEEYYRIYKENNYPKFDILNGRNVEWGGSQDVEFSQDGEWAKYTEYLSFQDFIARFGSTIKFSTLEEIVDLYSPISADHSTEGLNSEIDFEITDIIAANPSMSDPSSKTYLDPRTADGQNKLKNLYKSISLKRDANNAIRVEYITWRWSKNAKIVKDRQGKERLVDEHYVLNPSRDDITVRKVKVPQVWHGYIIAGKYYVNIAPVEYQYDHLSDVYKPKLTIHGIRYNTYMNNVTKNASFVDLGKPLNLRLNMLLKKIEEYENTDIGKLLFITQDVLPRNMTWGQWYSSMFNSKVVPLAKKFEGQSANELRPFAVEDMSRDANINSLLEKLSYFEQKLVLTMHYNPSKFGDISQYATNQNTQASILGVDRQMIRFTNKRRMLKQDMMTTLCNITMSCFKDNEYMKSLLLDDLQKAYYELNIEPFATSFMALFIVDDFQESEKVNGMRQLALTMIQNNGSARDVGRIYSADSMAEIDEILAKSDKRVQMELLQKREHEEKLAKMNAEQAQAAFELQKQFDLAKIERQEATKLKLAEINASFMANAQDIDKNFKADSLQSMELQIASKEKMHAKEMSLEEKKISKM